MKIVEEKPLFLNKTTPRYAGLAVNSLIVAEAVTSTTEVHSGHKTACKPSGKMVFFSLAVERLILYDCLVLQLNNTTFRTCFPQLFVIENRYATAFAAGHRAAILFNANFLRVEEGR